MLGFLLTVVVTLAAGLGVSNRLWRRFGGDEETGACERFLSGALIGIALLLAANWLLATTHILTRGTLIAVVAMFGVIAVVFRPSISRPRLSPLLIPLALWTLFALWKGAVLPPLSHDVLSYHLPKAVMMLRAHGFGYFVAPDSRITSLPANYELLLTDVLALAGNDRLTEWIGTIAFLLFLCTVAAFAERWWARPHRALVALTAATAPVLLLHSSADKNDILTCVFAAAALLWGARWSARGGRMPMLLLIVSLGLAAGTKPSAGAIAAGLAPFLLLRWREVRVRDVMVVAAAGLAAFLLLGGVPYIVDAVHAAGFGAHVESTKAGGGMVIQWGDWANLWRVPALMFLVPFARNATAVYVPWLHQYWFWPRYEIYFSHYGTLISLLCIALPFCIWRDRRVGDEVARRERRYGSLAAAFAFALILPIHMPPLGMFAALPRYVAFILPIIVCQTVPPLVEAARTRSRLIEAVAIGSVVLIFLGTAIDCAVNDRFAPLEFVRWAARHPGTRRIYFNGARAGSIVDSLAGPKDTIAVDGAFDTWVYPAYGAQLTRQVIFLPQPATAAAIPPNAQWVIIDRSWARFWGNPKLTNMGKFFRYIGKGTPTADDVRLLDELLHDPAWRLVYYDSRANNAVFRRTR